MEGSVHAMVTSSSTTVRFIDLSLFLGLEDDLDSETETIAWCKSRHEMVNLSVADAYLISGDSKKGFIWYF